MSLILIPALACLALLISETSGIMQWLKYELNLKNLKPFDCALCLGWWLGLSWFIAKGDYLHAAPYAAMSSVLAVIISKFIRQ